jgi:hypothetical protein
MIAARSVQRADAVARRRLAHAVVERRGGNDIISFPQNNNDYSEAVIGPATAHAAAP